MFSEYRNVLKSHHSTYSEDFVTSSSIGSLSMSHAIQSTMKNNRDKEFNDVMIED